MTWRDDDDLTEPKDGEEGPAALSRTLDRARQGDRITFEFQDDGSVIDGEYGKSTRFIVRPVRSDVPLETSNGEDAVIDGEEHYAFITGSARLLSKLAEVDDLEGKEVEIEVLDTGMEAAYSVSE